LGTCRERKHFEDHDIDGSMVGIRLCGLLNCVGEMIPDVSKERTAIIFNSWERSADSEGNKSGRNVGIRQRRHTA